MIKVGIKILQLGYQFSEESLDLSEAIYYLTTFQIPVAASLNMQILVSWKIHWFVLKITCIMLTHI